MASGLGISGVFLDSVPVSPSLPLAPPPILLKLKPGNFDMSIPSIPSIPSAEKFLNCSANFSKSFISIPSPNFGISPAPASCEAPSFDSEPAPIKISCMFLIVSSNLFLSSSSLIASNNFAVSPNESLSEILVIIEKRISCKYFQIVSRVFFEMSGVFHTSLKSISGKKCTSTYSFLSLASLTSLASLVSLPSLLKISAFLYKISKKRIGYTFLEYSYKNFTRLSSKTSSATTLPSFLTEMTTKLSFNLSLYSGNVVVKSFIKSVNTFLNSSGTTSASEFDSSFLFIYMFNL